MAVRLRAAVIGDDAPAGDGTCACINAKSGATEPALASPTMKQALLRQHHPANGRGPATSRAARGLRLGVLVGGLVGTVVVAPHAHAASVQTSEAAAAIAAAASAPASAATLAAAASATARSAAVQAEAQAVHTNQAVKDTLNEDARIAAAVAVALARAPAIPDVGVDVNARVVTLSGVVDNAQQRDRAARLAKGIKGVAEVENQLQVSTRLSTRLTEALDDLLDRATRMLAKLPMLLLAGLLVWAMAWLGRVAAARIRSLHVKSRNPYLLNLFSGLAQALLVGLGLLLALDLLGATAVVGALLGSAGVVGLAIGFAFRDIAENYIAGAMLSLRQPFSPGDSVDIAGKAGRVVALTARATVLMTGDGNHLQLPNADVFKAAILNYSRNRQRRFLFQVDLEASHRVRDVERVALPAIGAVPGVLAQPAPSLTVQSLGSAGLLIEFVGWIDQTQSDFGRSRSAAIRAVKAALASAGIQTSRNTQYVVNATLPAADARQPEAPAVDPGVDTSVDTSIDHSLADAQREAAATNLLAPINDQGRAGGLR